MPPLASDEPGSPKDLLEEGLLSIKQALALGANDVAANISSLVLKNFPNEIVVLELAVDAYHKTGDLDRAIDAQQKLLTLNPKNESYHRQYVEFNIKTKAITKAANACKNALNLCGYDCELASWFLENWTNLELNSRRCMEPIDLWLKNMNLNDRDSIHNLSSALTYVGRNDEALEIYANNCVTAWNGERDLNKDAVEGIYDTMADIYDQNKLDISFGAIMAAFITELLGEHKKFIILDTACGTGITGKHLKHIAAKLIGFDLSQNMLNKATSLGIYDSLLKASFEEMHAILPLYVKAFDLIISSCALYHVPQLDQFFYQSAKLIKDGGHLFFSVDPAPDHMDIGVTTDEPIAEYAHSKRYIRRLSSEFGFSEVEIRVMAHRPNPGYWCAFQKIS